MWCAYSLSRVQLFVTPRTVAHWAPLSMGILQARILEWVAMSYSRGSSQPRGQPRSPALQVDSLPSEPPGKPKNTGVGNLALLPPGDLPDPGIKLGSPALQVDSLPSEPPGKPLCYNIVIHNFERLCSICSYYKILLYNISLQLILYLIVCTTFSPLPSGNHQFVLYICEFAFVVFTGLLIFLVPHVSDIIVFVFLTYLT